MVDRRLHLCCLLPDRGRAKDAAAQRLQLVPSQVRTFNLAEQKVIRDLNPTDMNRLIAVSGMVTRTSSVIPDIRRAVGVACTALAALLVNVSILPALYDGDISIRATSCCCLSGAAGSSGSSFGQLPSKNNDDYSQHWPCCCASQRPTVSFGTTLATKRCCRCGLFKCESCGAETVAWNVEGIIEEPTVCPDAGCGAKHLMKLLHNRSEFSNKQLIKMQVGCHGLLANSMQCLAGTDPTC